MKFLSPAVLAMFLIAAPSVMAAGYDGASHNHSPEKMAIFYFDKMDLNEDKIVTKEEFEKSSMKKMVKSFDALEPDGTGILKRNSFIKNFIKAHSDPKPKV